MAVRRSGLTLPNSANPPELRGALGRVVELLRVWNGEGRDQLDRVLTAREFETAIGLARQGKYDGLAGAIQNIPGSYQPPAPVTPIAPTGVTAVAAFRNVVISWDEPGYAGHAYAEIWRSGQDVLGQATLIGSARGRVYSDSDVVGAHTYYYWVRFVSVTALTGPYNATQGTEATTAPDVGYLLEQLTDSITESQLYADLNSRIDLIDASELVPGSVNARVLKEAQDRATALAQEASDRASALAQEASDRASAIAQEGVARDAAIAQEASDRASALAQEASDRTAAIAQEVLDRDGAILVETNVRISEDQALAEDITALGLVINDPDTGVAATATAVNLLDTRVGSAEGNISANASDIQALQASIGDPDEGGMASAVAALDARVDTAEGNISVNASDITALESTVNNSTTGVAANASAISALDTRVDAAEGAISTQASDISALESTVNNSTTGVAANSSAISVLDTRVNVAEGRISTNSSDISSLESTVNNSTTGVAATASALSGLSTRVDTAEGNISTNASDITALESTVNNPTTGVGANASAISGLSTRVDTAEGTISSHSSSLLALSNTVNDAQTGVAATAGAVSLIDTRVGNVEGDVSSHSQQLLQLHTAVDALEPVNLVFNGDASEGSNAGWAGFTYVDLGGGEAEFSTTAVATAIFSNADNYIPVSIDRRYHLSMTLRCAVATTSVYAGFACFDSNKVEIRPYACWRSLDRDTTLASSVTAGATVVHVTPASAPFYGTASPFSFLQLAPDQENGNLPAESIQIASINASGSPWVITLFTPVVGSYAAGTAVGNSTSGASYQYALVSNEAPGVTNKSYEVDIGGWANDYDTAPIVTSQFRVGTAYISPMVLANYVNPSTTYVDDIGVTEYAPSDSAHAVTLEEAARALDGLSAQYTVKIDNNGAIAGFGLASTAPWDTSGKVFSEFYINADRFAISHQTAAAADKVAPFIVAGNKVYMNTALIQNAAITNAQIYSLAADKIYAASGTIADVIIDTGHIGNAMIADAAITNAKIANAAITNAKIGNAAVDTLSVAGRAITYPRSSSSSSAVTLSNTFQAVHDFTWTAVNSGLTEISIAAVIYMTWNISGEDDFQLEWLYRILLNGATLLGETQGGYLDGETASGASIASPGTAFVTTNLVSGTSYTLSFQARYARNVQNAHKVRSYIRVTEMMR